MSKSALSVMKRALPLCFFLLTVFSCSAPALGGPKPTRVLGKLGQATVKSAIYARPSSSSRRYYVLKPREYVIVNPSSSSEWLRVVLQNGASGYVRARDIIRLSYDVTQAQPDPVSSSRSEGSVTSRGAMVNYSLRFIGTPYVWGGNDPSRGVDCSGFIQQMYGKISLRLPRTAAEQALVGKPIYRLEDLQAGDRLYFWDKKKGKIGHTGMYMSKGMFVHSSAGRKQVATDDIRQAPWSRMLVSARR